MYDYDEIYHHGTKGMKWGIRRFQNKDGSLTPEGQKRRSIKQVIKEHQTAKKRKAALEKARQTKAANQKAAAERKKLLEAGKLSPKKMTDEELQARMDRINLEKQYKEAIKNDRAQSRGKRFVDKLIDSSIDKIAEQATADIIAQAVKAFEAKGVNSILGNIQTKGGEKLFDGEQVFTNNKRK